MDEDGRAELGEEDAGACRAIGGGPAIQPCRSGAFLRGGVSDVVRVLPQRELHDQEHEQQQQRGRDHQLSGRGAALAA